MKLKRRKNFSFRRFIFAERRFGRGVFLSVGGIWFFGFQNGCLNLACSIKSAIFAALKRVASACGVGLCVFRCVCAMKCGGERRSGRVALMYMCVGREERKGKIVFQY